MTQTLFTLSNPKTQKGETHGYLTAVLHLAPASLSGRNVCPFSSAGCRAACLNTAGRGRFASTQDARIAKTRAFTRNPREFTERLAEEITTLERRAHKRQLKLAIRLNGTSDLPWESLHDTNKQNLMQRFPAVQFYDYTKSPIRMRLWLSKRLPPNYHLTFSLSEDNEQWARTLHADGANIALVGTEHAAERFATPGTRDASGSYIVPGDTHDLTFLHPPHSILYLKPKGAARHDASGFVRIG